LLEACRDEFASKPRSYEPIEELPEICEATREKILSSMKAFVPGTRDATDAIKEEILARPAMQPVKEPTALERSLASERKAALARRLEHHSA
jgi:hypothetical protein